MGNDVGQWRAAVGCFAHRRHRCHAAERSGDVSSSLDVESSVTSDPADIQTAIDQHFYRRFFTSVIMPPDLSQRKRFFNSLIQILLFMAGIEMNPGPGPGSASSSGSSMEKGLNESTSGSSGRKYPTGAQKRQKQKSDALKLVGQDPKQRKISFSSRSPSPCQSSSGTPDAVFLSPPPPSPSLSVTPPPASPSERPSPTPSPSPSLMSVDVDFESFTIAVDNDEVLHGVVPGSGSSAAEAKTAKENENSELADIVDGGQISDDNGNGGDHFAVFDDTYPLTSAKKTLLKNTHPIQPLFQNSDKQEKLPFDKDKVYFRSKGGEKRLWVSYCLKRKKVFCWVCRGFCPRPESTLSTCGWGSVEKWESGHVYDRLKTHEGSNDHLNAVDTFFQFSNSSSVSDLLHEGQMNLRMKQVEERREVVLRIINIVLHLAKQGAAFRGKKFEAAYTLPLPCNHGNFLEEVKSRSFYDPVLRDHMLKCIDASKIRHENNPSSKGRGSLVTFMSPTTICKILNIISSMIQDTIRDKIIANGGRFSISLDGCQDISVKEMLSLVGRFVDEFGPVEVLLDISAASHTSGEALLTYIQNTLKKLRLDINDIVGYSFDGAGNMAGVHSGVQARLKELVPDSVFQHCYAHVLNLILQKSCNMIPQAASLFKLLRESATNISESYKRVNLWKSLSELLCPNIPPRLMIKFGKTRWWAKAKACNRIFQENGSLLPVIVSVLEIVSRDKTLLGTVRSTLIGEVKSFCSFETLATGLLFQKIFSVAGPVSDYLQTVQLDHVQAARLTANLIPAIESIKVDEVLVEAEALAEKINKQLEELNSNQAFTEQYSMIEARIKTSCSSKRVSVVPRRLGERADDEMRRVTSEQSPNYPLKVNALIPILDYCLQGLRDRFGDASGTLQIFKSCSFLSPERFSEVVENGIPEGSLDHLCRLARVDPSDVSKELLVFAKAYPDLMKNIQTDFKPTTNLAELDVDFEDLHVDDDDDGSDGETENEIDDPDPVFSAAAAGSNDKGGSTNKFKCEERVVCRGCLRCPYRVLRKHGLYATAFANLCAVYKIALTLPCTQVSCERCFSKLKIIKTRLRNSMADEYLRSAMIIAVEREIADSLDHKDILQKFAVSSTELSRLLLN